MKAFLLTAALVAISLPAHAEMLVTDIHAFETSEGMKNGAVLMTVKNTGNEDDKLIGASAPASDQAEIHEMSHDNGIMKMREIGAVTIPAGKEVTFKPDGYHVMLLGLKEPLQVEKSQSLVLKFQKAGEIKTTFDVRSRRPAETRSDHMNHSGH